jgi:crotonobetainyl-CoA:carnitine CoA-transferase CaiB-like acyl-CoA transferase
VGVLTGLKVLDLSWGVAGPAATMLLCDHGADVVRIEHPDGEPFADLLDSRIYNRGKRSAVLDLRNAEDNRRFRALAADADVMVESFEPGVTQRLGIDYESLAATSPRLVYCSITGYGRNSRHDGRPAFDQLVAARTGYQWEVRAWPGSAVDAAAGLDLFPPDTAHTEADRHWLERSGPVFMTTPSASVSAGYLATLGISAALRARETTGRGQWVETSLLQGLIAYQGFGWVRFEGGDPTAIPAAGVPIMNYSPGVAIMSGPWSFYECADGRWINQWTARPEWAILAGEGDRLRTVEPAELEALVAETGGRAGSLERQLETRRQAMNVFKKFTQADWVRHSAEAGFCMQPVRSPEEVRCDPELLAQGAVVEIDDPELGPIRQSGILYRLHATPGRVQGPARPRGADTDAVRAEADRLPPPLPGRVHRGEGPAGPLAGVRAIDFGVAMAGPWGGELLAQLGADVIKVDPVRQNAWLSTPMAMHVNRSKRHLQLDVKSPEGLAVAHDLVANADIVLMNIRIQAARKLGLDYESLRTVNPSLIYCHTAGFDDSRAHLPGNDQTGNAVGGTEWEDGGCAHGGRPYWSFGSGGDLGNGYLSAIAMVQALYHRDRTGEGQKVDTSILNAALFATARCYCTPDGTPFDRLTGRPDLLGVSALYGIYACREGWLCLAVITDAHWTALAGAIPSLARDRRFADRAGRRADDDALREAIERELRTDSADGWWKVLDQAGVPCEVSSTAFIEGMFEDPDLIHRELIVTRDGHQKVGRTEMFGRLIGFSDTRAPIGGPPAVPGQHSREILREFGYSDERISSLLAAGAVFEFHTGSL